MQEPVGGGVQYQPELVGGGLAARSPVRCQVPLVGLDQVFGLASCAVHDLVEPPRRAAQAGDDEPAIRSPVRSLDPGDHPTLDAPGLGGIGELAVAANLLALAFDPAHGGSLGEALHPGEQDLVAGQAEDVADAVALAPSHRLGPAVVAVAADQDVDLGPAGADSP